MGAADATISASEANAADAADAMTVAEARIGLDLSAWIGVLAPARTPAAIVDRLNAELATILRSPEAAAWARQQGLEVIGGPAAAFAATLNTDIQRWGSLVQRLKLMSP